MTKTIGVNTSVALQNARKTGLVVRDFVTIRPKDRSTGAQTELCLWNGHVPITAIVIDPKDGTSDSRVFNAAGSLLDIPPIPAGLMTEVRTVRIRLSKLTAEVLNIMRTYDAKMAPVEIHRGLFDPDTRRLVDPAICRFVGFINNAPIRTPKAGSEGFVEAECVSQSRILTKTSGLLFSMEALKKRSGDLFGKYLDVAGAWRVWWGQEEKPLSDKKDRPKQRYYRF
jgi:hypothetical protein